MLAAVSNLRRKACVSDALTISTRNKKCARCHVQGPVKRAGTDPLGEDATMQYTMVGSSEFPPQGWLIIPPCQAVHGSLVAQRARVDRLVNVTMPGRAACSSSFVAFRYSLQPTRRPRLRPPQIVACKVFEVAAVPKSGRHPP